MGKVGPKSPAWKAGSAGQKVKAGPLENMTVAGDEF